MIISIGSRSHPKISAVCRAFARYPEIWTNKANNLEFIILPEEVRKDESVGKQIDKLSKVSCNPMTLEENIDGAKNRAREAFNYAMKEKNNCDYGVGIESGMFSVPETNTGYFGTSVCTIFDGKNFSIGLSPSFEYPQAVVDGVLEGKEIGHMIDVFGENCKGRKGAIGVVTSERVYRDDFEEQAVIMALTPIIRSDIYFRNKE